MINSYIALGYACNHKCINCPLTTFDRLHGELDKDIIIKNVKELSRYKDKLHITISGGEPTLNPSFFDVLKILGKSNSYITILSNATTCKDEKTVLDIINSIGSSYDLSRLNYVTAIHSYDKNVHDRLTATPGSFDETIKGLENLSRNNIHVIIKIIMNKVTAKDMLKTIDYICNHFKEKISIELCVTDYAGRCGKHIDELYIDSEDLEILLEKALDNFENKKYKNKLKIIESPLCLIDPYYWKYFQVKNNNELTYIAPNNEKKNNISKTIESDCHTNYLECNKCDLKKYCNGVWESTYKIEKDKKKIIRPIKIEKGIY